MCECRTCNGEGWILVKDEDGNLEREICPSCEGYGVRKDPNRDWLD